MNVCVCVLKWAGGGKNCLGHFYPPVGKNGLEGGENGLGHFYPRG